MAGRSQLEKEKVMADIARDLDNKEFGDIAEWIVPKLELEKVITYEEFEVLRRMMRNTAPGARLMMLFCEILVHKDLVVILKVPQILRNRYLDKAADVVSEHLAKLD